MAHKVIRYALGTLDFSKKVLGPIRGGGIRRRLLMWGLGLFGIALIVVVAASYYYTVRQIERDAAELQSEIASVTAERIRDFVQRKIERVSDTANAVSLYPLGSKEQQLLVSLLAKNDASFTDVSIIDAQGMEVLKVSDRRVYFPSDLSNQIKSAKFNKAIKGEDYISPVHTSERFQPYVTLAIPLWGGAQSVAGVIAAEADLSFLWEVVGKIQFGSAGYAYLVDEHGNLIAHKDGSLVLKRMNLGQLDKVQEFIGNRTGSDRNPAHEGRGLLDRSVLATYAPVPDLGWAVILEEPIDAALANVEKLKRYAIVLLVVSLAVGAVIIAWVSGRMTGPIRELREGVATIGSGNLEHRTSIKTGDEIQDLAEEFNRMTDALQNSYATLEQKVEERTKEAETRSRQLSVLNKIGAAVSRSLNLEMVLNEAIEKMIETLNFDASWIYILDPSEEVLILKAYKGIGDEVAHSMDRRKRSVGISGKIFETGERFVFEGVQNDTEYNHLSSRNKLQSLGFSSSAGFPIKANEKVIGVLHLASKVGRHFAPDELQLIESIAQEIGVAAENARLFEQVNQKTAELGHMNQELQEANQAKDEFLNVMSHELRTPLNVITGYAEVLSQGVLGEIQREQMHAVKTISYQSKELLRMINEILQVGSIEAGKVKANCENVNLLDFLFELKSGYEILSKKEISLHWDIPPSLPIVWTDGEKLKHVLQNLVNNAIKFTETGGVTFSACSFSESIEFKVKDTGIGMPQDMLPSIFQMFRQLDSSSTRSYGGSGVGLYIVKKFVDLLGGKIEVESVLGKGSTFTITLSLNAAEKFNASQADLEAKLAS